jgi:hypothetical protein
MGLKRDGKLELSKLWRGVESGLVREDSISHFGMIELPGDAIDKKVMNIEKDSKCGSKKPRKLMLICIH